LNGRIVENGRASKKEKDMNTEEMDNKPDTQPEEVQPETAQAEAPTSSETQSEQASASAEEFSVEEKLQREVAEWKDKYTRLFAEFDNFRKRTIKERADLISSSTADVLKDMLPVIDDFDRAVKANESVDDIAVVKEGFVLIHSKFYKKLESKGLKPIDAQGKPFDTDFHEAITSFPAPSEDMKGKVVDEVEKGYLLNDKVLRFSKVVIGQ
jgi:molecular chaperone GrpE